MPDQSTGDFTQTVIGATTPILPNSNHSQAAIATRLFRSALAKASTVKSALPARALTPILTATSFRTVFITALVGNNSQ